MDATATKDRRVMRAEGREVPVAALFRTEYASLASLAALITGDRALADDIVMDAFVKLYAKWGSLGSIDRPEFYVKAMVVNLCRSKPRRFRRAEGERPLPSHEIFDRIGAATHEGPGTVGRGAEAAVGPKDMRPSPLRGGHARVRHRGTDGSIGRNDQVPTTSRTWTPSRPTRSFKRRIR